MLGAAFPSGTVFSAESWGGASSMVPVGLSRIKVVEPRIVQHSSEERRCLSAAASARAWA